MSSQASLLSRQPTVALRFLAASPYREFTVARHRNPLTFAIFSDERSRLLTIQGKRAGLRAKSDHISSHLPAVLRGLAGGRWPFAATPCSLEPLCPFHDTFPSRLALVVSTVMRRSGAIATVHSGAAVAPSPVAGLHVGCVLPS